MTIANCEDGRNEAEFDACTGKSLGDACVLSDGPAGMCAELTCTDAPGGRLLVCVGTAKANPIAGGTSGTRGASVDLGELEGGGCAIVRTGTPHSLGTFLVLVAFFGGLWRRRERRQSPSN